MGGEYYMDLYTETLNDMYEDEEEGEENEPNKEIS